MCSISRVDYATVANRGSHSGSAASGGPVGYRRWIAISLAFLFAVSAAGLDYTVKPVRPDLVHDEATTLLLDFSKPAEALPADEGLRAINRDLIHADGFYTGALSIPSEGRFDPRSWTIEMIMRVPEDVAAAGTGIDLGGWNRGATTRLDFSLPHQAGPGYRLFGRHGVEGRTHEFNFAAGTGGRHTSIHSDAPGEWIYLAAGLDMARRRGGIIVRSLDGVVLKENIRYVGVGELGMNFLQEIPDEEQAAATEANWEGMLRSFANLPEADLILGADELHLRSLRISNEYRPEVVEAQPDRSSFTTGIPGRRGGSGGQMRPAPFLRAWRAEELAPERTTRVRTERMIGFPHGRSNYRVAEVEETYLPIPPASEPLRIELGELPIGIYTLEINGKIDPAGREALNQVWRPCPMDFEALDKAGERIGWGRMLLKQSLAPRQMQAFAFQVNEPGPVTAVLSIPERAMETPMIREILLIDALADIPDVIVKTSQLLSEGGSSAQAETLTEERKKRDDDIWRGLPPLNTPTDFNDAFQRIVQPINPPRWQLGGSSLGPITLVNRDTRETFTYEQIIAGEPMPGDFPDDGTGVFLLAEDYPELAHDAYLTLRARPLARQGLRFIGNIIARDEGSGNAPVGGLARRYRDTGDVEAGHDAAMVLVRFAYDYPGIDFGLQAIVLTTHHPDLVFNAPSSYARGGHFLNPVWSAPDLSGALNAYDDIFPFIQGNQVFADAVNRFIPWVQTPEDVIRLIDRRLVLRQAQRIRDGRSPDFGVLSTIGTVVGPHPLIAYIFDLTSREINLSGIAPYQEQYAYALGRLGHYLIGSINYTMADAAGHIDMAMSMKRAREEGIDLPMDLSDVEQFPKIRGAADFLIDVSIAGGYWLIVGTANAVGSHQPPNAAARITANSSRNAVQLMNHPRHAWLLVNRHRVPDEDIVALAETERDPILHNDSRVLPGWGGIIEAGVDETDLRNKSAMFMNTSLGQGHAHSDQLDLNLYGLGLPMAVDLGQRNEGRNWSRPHAGWAFLHNMAIAHPEDHTGDPRNAGAQNGEPWLRDFAPPLMRGSYVNQQGTVRHDREVILMPVGDGEVHYAFDLQRISGDNFHTWCFHGVQSHDLQLNVPMRSEVVRWTDRMLPGRGEKELPLSQKIGTAGDTLKAVWTATREPKEYEHQFAGGGVVKTVALEQTVLGELYDPDLPPAHLRATLLGHGGATVMEGKPFSQSYNYAFPFLWVQTPAGEGATIFPAVYEWYRGEETTILEAKLVSRDPLVVEVKTRSGQTDAYRLDGEVFSVVSRDNDGVRYVQLAGGAKLEAPDVRIEAEHASYEPKVTAVDYSKRTVTLDGDLPSVTGALLASTGRNSWVNLDGRGRSAKWHYDLLVQRSAFSDLAVVDENHITIKPERRIFHAGSGNRSPRAFTLTTEDHAWQFRHTGEGDRYEVIARPEGGVLSPDVFTDANDDGRIHVLGYEIGVGDRLLVPASVILRRTEHGYEIKTNVSVKGEISGKRFDSIPAADWQVIR